MNCTCNEKTLSIWVSEQDSVNTAVNESQCFRGLKDLTRWRQSKARQNPTLEADKFTAPSALGHHLPASPARAPTKKAEITDRLRSYQAKSKLICSQFNSGIAHGAARFVICQIGLNVVQQNHVKSQEKKKKLVKDSLTLNGSFSVRDTNLRHFQCKDPYT